LNYITRKTRISCTFYVPEERFVFLHDPPYAVCKLRSFCTLTKVCAKEKRAFTKHFAEKIYIPNPKKRGALRF
jgi:hypothetical protein